MSDKLFKRLGENQPKQEGVSLFNNLQQAIDAIKEGGISGLYRDTYMDQINPRYIAFTDKEKFNNFLITLDNLKTELGGSLKRIELFDELERIAGDQNIEPNHLKLLYRDEKWVAGDPNQLLADDNDRRTMVEDSDWNTDQVAHFKKRATLN